MEDWLGVWYWVEYSHFSVGPESDNYTLSVTGYQTNSTTGDSIDRSNGMMFSTMDVANDMWDDFCSVDQGGEGGWWFKYCMHANPSGYYAPGGVVNKLGFVWTRNHLGSSFYSFKTMIYTIIPVQYNTK